MQSSVTVTIPHANSSLDAACAGRGCGAHGVTVTASASTASAIRRTAHVPAHQGTVGSFAGNHVLPGSMVKTAETGGEKNIGREQMYRIKKHRNMQFYRWLMFSSLV